MLAREDRRAAKLDPEYHRHVMFGAQDRALERRLGRELEPHEAQGRLPWPQREIVRRCERAIAAREGEVITIRMSRQTGKNETEAFLEARALAIWRQMPGSTWVRTAPTYRPQIVNSKLRLERMLSADPLTRRQTRNREGYIVQCEHAQVQFLSADANANVVGATASIALSVDEAHKIDQGKFDEDFGPFTAWTNAPTLMWGVAADKRDLLYEYREINVGTDRLLEFPAAVWCELSRAYAAHYESRVKKLGKDHIVIKTQYDLIDVESLGGYLSATQQAALFGGQHVRLQSPRVGLRYALVVDIGGEAESQIDDAELRAEQPDRDSTVAWVLEWDPSEPTEPYPAVRVVQGVWWTGRHHMSVAPELVRLAQHWGVSGGCIDARGVGEAVAGAVCRAVPAIVPYKASAADVSVDCYDLLARLNTGRVTFWRGDPAGDPELREAQAQARHTQYEIRGHDLMRLTKPTGRGSSGLHIDGIKALTYLHRALVPAGAGSSTEETPLDRGEFSPFGQQHQRFNPFGRR